LSLGTASLGDIKKLGRIGLKTIIYFTVTTVIAIVIGLVAGNLLKPGAGLNEQVKQDLLKIISNQPRIKHQLSTRSHH